MPVSSEVKQQLGDLVGSARTVLIAAVPGNDDAVAAALGIGEVLSRSKKSVTIAAAAELSALLRQLPGHERIISSVTKNFVITLKEAVGSVEKVSYYTEGNDLHLVIHPKVNAPAFSTDKISYQDRSGGFDLIIVIGAQKLDDLGTIYSEDPGIYSHGRVVNVDLSSANTRFGQINIVNPQASSLSEEVVGIIKVLNLSLNREAATALLLGLDQATANFGAGRATAAAFEAAAFCLRAGGQRLSMAPAGQISKPAPAPIPPSPPPPDRPEEKSKESGQDQKENWLQPKIYKGGQLL
jgi:nanoRNase/pAp phosphatase (c-di-AMP/oligoRNAs hydrolase)